MQFVQNNWLLIVVMIMSGAMLLWPVVQRRLSPLKEIGLSEATRLLNSRKAVLLDIREPKEYEAGHAPNATHIPLTQLKSRVTELSSHTERPVIVYCALGNRCSGATSELTKAGFKEIYALRGGFKEWLGAGLPLEKAEKAEKAERK